ncbi:hypothetical protein CHCC20327_2545 [Bacillus licheniformis]|nr:hypothetical protein CHCC20327_2545 [Bacillus licheniformis]
MKFQQIADLKAPIIFPYLERFFAGTNIIEILRQDFQLMS